MNPGGSHRGDPLRQRPRLAPACGLLALVMLATLFALMAWASANQGQPGMVAAAVAVLICWLCSTTALIVAGLAAQTPFALQGQLGSIVLRTVVPLLMAILLDQNVPALSQAGVFGLMVPAYLVSLVTETLLALWLANSTRSVAKAS